MKNLNLILKNYRDNLSLFFFFFFPTLIVSGPFLSDLFVVITVIIFIFQTIKKKIFYYYNNFFFLYFLVFYIYILINSLFINFELINFLKTFSYIRFGLFALAIFYFIEKNSSIIKAIFYGFIFIFVLLIFDSLYQLINNKNIFGTSLFIDGDGVRLSSLFGDELILGSFLVRTLPVVIGIYFYLNIKKYYLYYSLFFLLLILIILSGERTSFALMILLISFLICFKKNLFYLLIIIILSLSFVHSSKLFKIRSVDLTLKQYSLLKKSVHTNQLKTFENQNEIQELNKKEIQKPKYYFLMKSIIPKQYFDIYLSALKMFHENKIMGSGVRSFRSLCNDPKYNISKFSCSTHPHNTYIQLLAETGLIGFLIIFSVFIFIIFNLIKFVILKIIKKKIIFSKFQLLLLFSAILSLWPLIPTGNFFNNWLSIIYYFPAGLFLWSKKVMKKFNDKD
jgi:O-antigen ligase